MNSSLEKIINRKDYIYPSCIDNKDFRVLRVDDMYIASLIVENYPCFSEFLNIVSTFPKNMKYDIGIYVSKKNSMDILKELTYSISLSGSELKTSNKNQIDFEILGKTKEDAINLRREIQINGEDIFFVNVIFTMYEFDKEVLFKNIHNLQSKLYSSSVISTMSNFRQLDSYLFSLPLMISQNNFIQNTYRNFTTSALCNQFPFVSNNLFDKDGILFGFFKNEKKICNVDIFNKDYINFNMCIFGSSGTGKSFFTKLLLIRHYLFNISQYVFDIEGEYEVLAKNLNVPYINLGSRDTKYYFNILQIFSFEIDIKKEDVVNYKIKKITDFLLNLLVIDNENYYKILYEAIRTAYENYEITNLESLYKKSDANNIFLENTIISNECFPTISDVLVNITDEKLKEKIEKEIVLKYPQISNKTNFDVEDYFNSLMIFGVKRLTNLNLSIFVNYILDIIDSYILKNIMLKNKTKTIIYFDEIWKFIKSKDTQNLSQRIFEMFKTIRKKNASIIAVTQDISDFFLFENGNYGKSILNNSYFKVFFKLEYEDSEILDKLMILNKNSLEKISSLSKAQASFYIKNSNIVLDIKKNNYELKILEEENDERK